MSSTRKRTRSRTRTGRAGPGRAKPQRRAVKNPSFDVAQDPPAWWTASFGSKTRAGIEMDEWRALNISTVWVCVSSIAIDIAKLPIHTYVRDGRGGKSRAEDHPAQWITNVEANPEMSALDFWDTLQWWALNWGNGYAEIERTGRGYPVALWPMEPWCTRVMRGRTGELYYEYRPRDSGLVRRIPAADVYHLRGMGNGLVGLNVIRYAADSLGGAAAADAFGQAFFGNGAHGGGVLEHPKLLTPKAFANLRESWMDRYAGVENTGKPIILEEGMKWSKMAFPPNEAQMLETRQFSVPDICRWYRFPPHKAMDLLRATFSNIEQQDLSYVGDTLMGWIRRQEQEASRKLLMPSERRTHLIERLLDAQLRADISSRYTAYSIGRQNGWLSPNDIREKESMNRIEGGDVYTVQVNMTTLDKVGQAAEPATAAAPKAPPKDGNAPGAARRLPASHREILEEVYERVLRLEADKVRRASAKPDLAGWAEKFYLEHAGELAARLFPTLACIVDHAQATGARVEAGSLRRAIDLLTADHVKASSAAILAGPKDLARTLDSWTTERPKAQAGRQIELLESLLYPKE